MTETTYSIEWRKKKTHEWVSDGFSPFTDLQKAREELELSKRHFRILKFRLVRVEITEVE